MDLYIKLHSCYVRNMHISFNCMLLHFYVQYHVDTQKLQNKIDQLNPTGQVVCKCVQLIY